MATECEIFHSTWIIAEEGNHLDTPLPPPPALPLLPHSSASLPPVSLISYSWGTLRISPLVLLSPPSPLLPSQDVVRGGSAPQRETAGPGGKCLTVTFHIILLIFFSLSLYLTFSLFVLLSVKTEETPGLSDIASKLVSYLSSEFMQLFQPPCFFHSFHVLFVMLLQNSKKNPSFLCLFSFFLLFKSCNMDLKRWMTQTK